MKKIFFLFLITALISPVSTQAIDLRLEKRLEVKGEIKAERQENKEARATNVQERKDQSLENKRTRAQAALKRLRQGIVNRYEVTLKQKASVEARIAKIETRPTPAKARDLTAAKAKLATFSDAKYKSDLAAFDAKAAAVLASDTPLKLTADLKASAKVLDADIKDLRRILADSLRLIIKAK